MEVEVAGRSKSEADTIKAGCTNENVYLQDVKCRTMFHNLSIKYMIIYLYMRLLDCMGCEWNAILCGWQDMCYRTRFYDIIHKFY